MNWQTKIKQITAGAASQFQILAGDTPLTFRQVFQGWQTEPSFRSFYTDVLATSPYPAFYWEHPPLTIQRLEEDYEFVLVNSSALSLIHSDPVPFTEKFDQRPLAVRFPNLRADAELVVPTPQSEDLSPYAHLARFVRKGGKEQQQFFWQLVGETALELIKQERCWLSTSGLGVHWLHVRFDARPKYYTHRPYVNYQAPMKKIREDFVIAQYQSGIENYAAFTREVGLWASEKYVFQKYLKKTDRILDLGCGTGRTTFSLFEFGYTDILGVDLTPEMIAAAKQIKVERSSPLNFQVGNAKALDLQTATFDVVIFSFNGLMSIPDGAERAKALTEIHRVLKEGGLFIFTTHDREQDENYFAFWREEQERWEKGEQSTELYEFGDIIATSKNEERPIFIHIPNQKEIQDFLMKGRFSILETFYRNEKFEESAQVKEKSGECRFWVVQKQA